MKKKIIIIIVIVLIIAILIGGGLVAYYISNKEKTTPEDIWNQYISYINEEKYEEMYEMITDTAKSQISKEDFIKRNENIYSGIDMANLDIQITNVEEEEKNISKINYTETMETSAGNVEFQNTVRIVKNDQREYKIEWSHNLILPGLNSTDKVRVKTIKAKRGEIDE